MLEQRIEELTAAVKALTEVFTIARNEGAAKLEKKSPLTAVVETIIKEEEAKKPSPTSAPSEPESKPVCYDDVKRAINALSAAKGKEVTIALLDKFGVKRGPELVEAQWADFMKEAQID